MPSDPLPKPKVKKPSRLKSILFNVLIFIVLISPLFAVSTYSYNRSYSDLTDAEYSHRKELAQLLKTTIEYRLDGVKDIGLAASSDISNLAKEGRWDEAMDEIQYISSEFKYIDRVFLVDKPGILKAIYPPSPEIIGKSFAFRDYFQGVSKNWEPYASEVFKRAPHPQFNTVAVAVPIEDKDGNIFGVLGMAMNLDSFYEIINNFKVNDQAFLYIVNQKGQIVAHPKYPAQGPIIDYSSVEVVKRLLNRESGVGVFYNSIEKEDRLASFEVVPKYNWGVVIAEPVKAAFAARDSYLQRVATIQSLLLLLNGLLAFFVIHSINRLKQLDRAKSEFVSLASHQLKTPASGVKAFLSMLVDGDAGPLNPQQKEFAETAYKSNERQIQVVDDLLNVARVETGRLALEKKDFNLKALLEEIINEASKTLQARKQTLDFVKPDEEVIINADQPKLRMVLSNLIDNASKYTLEGGSIHVRLESLGEKILVAVKDTGVGVAKKDLGKLFKKFSRIDNSQSTKVGGTGLGLYLVKEIIEMHKGKISVISTLGKGTEFMVELPKKEAKNV